MTLIQAFKVWWSYSWRASILTIPLMVILTAWSLSGLGSALEKMSESGQSPYDLTFQQLLGLATGGMSLMILSMVLMGVAQVLAMRWTLNSSWTDFRLKAIPPDEDAQGRPGPGDSGRQAGT
jgi:hypothetical protein